jgi:hypothetical protein
MRGELHSGGRTIPMRSDFLTELLQATRLEVDRGGEGRAAVDPSWSDTRIELSAFETHTETRSRV